MIINVSYLFVRVCVCVLSRVFRQTQRWKEGGHLSLSVYYWNPRWLNIEEINLTSKLNPTSPQSISLLPRLWSQKLEVKTTGAIQRRKSFHQYNHVFCPRLTLQYASREEIEKRFKLLEVEFLWESLVIAPCGHFDYIIWKPKGPMIACTGRLRIEKRR